MLDADGEPMDQNRNATVGEVEDDAWQQSFTVDTVAPALAATFPAGNPTLPINHIDITASETLAGQGITVDDVTLTGPAGAVTIDSIESLDGNVHRLHFAEQTADGEYTLTVAAAVTDVAGNPLDTDADGTFGEPGQDDFVHTLTLGIGPHVVSHTPQAAHDLSTGALSSIAVTFSEPVDFTADASGSLWLDDVAITGPAGGIPASNITEVAPNEFDITFAPQSADGIYTFRIGPDVTDLAGNPMDQDGDGVTGEGAADSLAFQFGAFTGMTVTVDGEQFRAQPFIREGAIEVPELGCRIKVADNGEIGDLHRRAAQERPCDTTTYVNFHGQIVAFSYRPVNNHYLQFLVELTGAPTDIRLMLPARTRLVENEAFGQLKADLERQAYLHLQQRGSHILPYRQYLRAKDLGIRLPEAEPVFRIGLLQEDEYGLEPAEVVKPKDFDLAKCYRLNPEDDDLEQTREANVHLLAALGKHDKHFVPVAIKPEYDGYSWADLPLITDIKVEAGNVIHEGLVWAGKLVCVDSVKIIAHTSDGQVFGSDVCMAVRPPEEGKEQKVRCFDGEVYITVDARKQLDEMNVWFHVGGFSDQGDTWDTQQYEFNRALEQFWAEVIGPDEPLRLSLMEAALKVDGEWKAVTIQADGTVQIHCADGKHRAIVPPAAEGGAS